MTDNFSDSLNGLNPGFSISLIVRSSRLEKNFIISDVSATYSSVYFQNNKKFIITILAGIATYFAG